MNFPNEIWITMCNNLESQDILNLITTFKLPFSILKNLGYKKDNINKISNDHVEKISKKISDVYYYKSKFEGFEANSYNLLDKGKNIHNHEFIFADTNIKNILVFKIYVYAETIEKYKKNIIKNAGEIINHKRDYYKSYIKYNNVNLFNIEYEVFPLKIINNKKYKIDINFNNSVFSEVDTISLILLIYQILIKKVILDSDVEVVTSIIKNINEKYDNIYL